MKEKLYNLIAHSGIWFLSKFFPEYFATEPLRPTDRYIEYPFVLKNLLPPMWTKILDVGCSGSMFPLLLKALGYEVHGLDIREYPYKEEIIFHRSDITTKNMFSNYFDIITAISTIEHIGLPNRYGAYEKDDGDFIAVQQIYDALRPNGTFLMTVPFGEKLIITKYHRIYDLAMIRLLLHKFYKLKIEYEPSPEADYKLALIKAVK